MFSNHKSNNSFVSIPKQTRSNNNNNNNIDVNKNKKKEDYETIRNIVLEKSSKTIEKYDKDNNKPKHNKFDIVLKKIL